MRRYQYLKISVLFCFITLSLWTGISCNSRKKVDTDFPQIKTRGKLIAITGYSATSYFIYKGKPMGYEYELLTRLAKHLGLELEIILENHFDEMFLRLNRGEGDIIAHGLTVTGQRKKIADFTDDLFTTRQVLVQRKPENWRKMKLHQIEEVLIRNPIALIGKKIYVKESSSYIERLRNLSEEIGGKIIIEKVSGDTTTEQLIRQVAEGKIPFTVADKNIALINQAQYPVLDVETALSLPQQIAWAVRQNSPQLLDSVNSWITQMKEQTAFYVIYNKYFKNRRAYVRRARSGYLSVTGGKISPYDSLIQKNAALIGWDWRLLAAMIFKESKFRPRVKSWSGAVGLMQLLPRTAREYGAKRIYKPADNIHAGVQFLEWLDNYWKGYIPNEKERIKFVLASYNVGQGHIQDARKLAEKYGRDPNRWEKNVAYFVLRLSEEKYFTDEVVNFGYCRGVEPYNYVIDIFEIFHQYQQLIPA